MDKATLSQDAISVFSLTLIKKRVDVYLVLLPFMSQRHKRTTVGLISDSVKGKLLHRSLNLLLTRLKIKGFCGAINRKGTLKERLCCCD